MSLRYSEAFIEQALIKVYSRGERTVGSVAEELNINCHTVKNWMKRKVANQVSELLNKEKALAEAAALLVLQKKFRALWEDEVK